MSPIIRFRWIPLSLLRIDDYLAEGSRRKHCLVGMRGILERKFPADERLQRPVLESGDQRGVCRSKILGRDRK